MTTVRVDALTLAQAARIMRALHRRRPDWFVWLYAIQAGENGPVKIGKTRRPPGERLAALQVGNAEPLRGLAAWRALEIEEKQIQGEFAAHRVRGEWFAPTPDLLYLVDRLGGDFIDWERTQ